MRSFQYSIDKRSSNILGRKTGYYNYLLIDPRNSQCFYVGKGKGRRVTNHFNIGYVMFRCTKRSNKIKSIVQNGYLPIVRIYGDNLTEIEANENEVGLIRFFGRKDKGEENLLNLTDGGAGVPGGIHSLKTKEKMAKTKIAMNMKGCKNHKSKRVYQYDLHGNYIKTWDSITDAKDNIPNASAIAHCLMGKKFKSSGGYMWFLEYKGIKTDSLILHPDKVKKEVKQYRISDDVLIGTYPGTKEACDETGITMKAIRYSFSLPDCKKGKEYYWRR